ncbi:hypothetical protein J4466_05260 [Candidatus Pacearchaeota archaeon]|nr:hypothetical protein [Candidatus Pacearchaeota archaeon]
MEQSARKPEHIQTVGVRIVSKDVLIFRDIIDSPCDSFIYDNLVYPIIKGIKENIYKDGSYLVYLFRSPDNLGNIADKNSSICYKMYSIAKNDDRKIVSH